MALSGLSFCRGCPSSMSINCTLIGRNNCSSVGSYPDPEIDSVASFGNLNGTLHGGAISTLVDVGTTVAIMSFDRKNRANVSADLSISFISGGPPNQEIFLLAQVDRIGRQMAFSNATIYDNRLEKLATGKHLKSFLEKTYSLESDTLGYPKKSPN